MSPPDTDGTPPEWGPPRSRTITWFDPHTARERAADLSGEELMQGIIDGRIPPPPITSVVGARLISGRAGESVFRCHPDESFFNPIGLIHGGLLCTLMDTAMGVAVQSMLPAGAACPSIELKVSFLKPVRADGSDLEIRGRALRTGRRIAFAEAHAYDSEGDLVGHATSSLAIILR